MAPPTTSRKRALRAKRASNRLELPSDAEAESISSNAQAYGSSALDALVGIVDLGDAVDRFVADLLKRADRLRAIQDTDDEKKSVKAARRRELRETERFVKQLRELAPSDGAVIAASKAILRRG